jgi:hypothetical protein
MKYEALIQRLREEATHDLHHETVALLEGAAQALAQPEPEQEPVVDAYIVHLYNLGYKSGHHDTVEGQYIDLFGQDMDTYHSDFVSEWLEETCNTTQPSAKPEQEPSSVQQAAMAQVCLDLHETLGCRWGDNVYSTINQLKAAAQRKPVDLTNDEINNIANGCHLGKSVQGAIREALDKYKEKNT